MIQVQNFGQNLDNNFDIKILMKNVDARLPTHVFMNFDQNSVL